MAENENFEKEEFHTGEMILNKIRLDSEMFKRKTEEIVLYFMVSNFIFQLNYKSTHHTRRQIDQKCLFLLQFPHFLLCRYIIVTHVSYYSNVVHGKGKLNLT